MLGFPTQKEHLAGPIALICISCLLHLSEPISSEWLGFYPQLVIDGEWWRMVFGQLLHTNTNHLLLNIAGIALVWALHGEYYRSSSFLSLSIISTLPIGLGLMYISEYGHYAGLSGVLHSLLAYGAVYDVKKGEKTGWLLMAGLSLKLAYEIFIGPSKETETLIGAAVAYEAHLLGFISGLFLALVVIYWQTNRQIKQINKGQ